MAVSRFNSQLVPKDSTEKYGYKFISLPKEIPLQAITTQSTGLCYLGSTVSIPTTRNSTLPGLLVGTTTATTILCNPIEVPNDVDSSQTCYVYIVSSNPLATASTTATALVTVSMAAYSNLEVVTTASHTITAEVFSLAPTTTANAMQISSAAALSAKPTPGEIMSIRMVVADANGNASTSHMIHGVMFKYFRRFL